MHFKVQTEQSRADKICLSSILKSPRSPPPLVPQPIPVIVSLKPSSSPSPGLAYESWPQVTAWGASSPARAHMSRDGSSVMHSLSLRPLLLVYT